MELLALLPFFLAVGLGAGLLIRRPRPALAIGAGMVTLPIAYLVLSLVVARVNDDHTANIGAGMGLLFTPFFVAMALATWVGHLIRRRRR